MARRGQLRVYLGAAPGVGKTYRMLDEGNRRLSRGTDVVIGLLETWGRPRTEERVGALPTVPRTSDGDMDVEAVTARQPEVVLVDGLERRWQQVETLLGAGIDVVTTVDIEHLESLNDVVESITGIAHPHTVPDAFVRSAQQVELVDMTPEALRRRMAHGNIYPPDRIDAALSNYFRPGNLTALRELALLWLADQVEEGLRKYRDLHGINATWETKERVVVGLTGGPEGEALIRRAARIAARSSGGDLLAVHIARSDGSAGSSAADLDRQRVLVESLGGTYHSIIGENVPDAVLDFARAKNATQIVIGASRRNPWLSSLTGPGTGQTITRRSGSIDVHVVSHEYIGNGRSLPRLGGGLTVRRRVTGSVLGAAMLTALLVTGTHLRERITFASEMLLLLFCVVVTSLVGGFYPAVVVAVAASLLLNFYFVEPLHTFAIREPENVLALVVFVVIAGLVSRVVDLAARRSTEAARSNAEAETMATLAGSLLRGENTITALLERVRETFAVASVTLLRRGPDGLLTESVAEVGEVPAGSSVSESEVAVGEQMVMVLRGRTLAAEDQRLLVAFAAEVALAYRQRELSEVAARAEVIARADRARTALLNAVSHDLRTPIASAKAAVSSLRSTEIEWSEDDRRELLADADTALDRLTALVTNLLDLSRLQAGALSVSVVPVGLDDVVNRALSLSAAADAKFDVDVPPELPTVQADAGLLDRVVANLIENALRYSPSGEVVRIAASAHGDQVELRITDRGPGIPVAAREAVFEAFQRRDDRAVSTGAGVGLGLAIAKGFVEAMGGAISLEDTPGGGLTVIVSLKAGD